MELEDKTLLPQIEKIETKFSQIVLSAEEEAKELVKAAKRESQKRITDKEKQLQKQKEELLQNEIKRIEQDIDKTRQEHELSLQKLDTQAEENINSVVDEILKLIVV